MFTDEQLRQLRSVVRDEVAPLNTKIDAVEQRLNARMDGVEMRLNAKIDGVEQRLNRRLDKSEEAFGGLLHEILNTVSDHHTKLERRVERIEDHLGFSKPH